MKKSYKILILCILVTCIGTLVLTKYKLFRNNNEESLVGYIKTTEQSNNTDNTIDAIEIQLDIENYEEPKIVLDYPEDESEKESVIQEDIARKQEQLDYLSKHYNDYEEGNTVEEETITEDDMAQLNENISSYEDNRTIETMRNDLQNRVNAMRDTENGTKITDITDEKIKTSSNYELMELIAKVNRIELGME